MRLILDYGGLQVDEEELRELFPNVKKMISWAIYFHHTRKIGNSFISIDDMTKFTNYVETNQQ